MKSLSICAHWFRFCADGRFQQLEIMFVNAKSRRYFCCFIGQGSHAQIYYHSRSSSLYPVLKRKSADKEGTRYRLRVRRACASQFCPRYPLSSNADMVAEIETVIVMHPCACVSLASTVAVVGVPAVVFRPVCRYQTLLYASQRIVLSRSINWSVTLRWSWWRKPGWQFQTSLRAPFRRRWQPIPCSIAIVE